MGCRLDGPFLATFLLMFPTSSLLCLSPTQVFINFVAIGQVI